MLWIHDIKGMDILFFLDDQISDDHCFNAYNGIRCGFRRTVQMRRGHAALVGGLMRETFGIELPEAGQSATAPGATVLWTQPGGWLVTAPRIEEGFLAGALALALESHASVIDQSHGRVTIGLDGERVRDVLAKGCRIDLHPREFGPGRVASTVIAQVNCLLHRVDERSLFEVTVSSTLAEPFFHWLTESAAEFGYTIA